MAQLMIFLSLNWWVSLNDELQPLEMNVANGNVNINPLAVVFSSWRMIASVVAGVGVVIQVPFLDCAALDATHLSTDKYCSAWLEPPQVVASLLGLDEYNDAPGLETLATIAVTIYATYLVYYMLVILPEIGRDGRASRSFFTFIDPLIALGILKQ